MTDSAKRTASKTAVGETAVGKAEAEPIADSATEAPTTPEPETPAGAAESADLDDTKRKFREALDRKRQVHADGQAKGSRDGNKVGGAHGPAASKRSFRRKSG